MALDATLSGSVNDAALPSTTATGPNGLRSFEIEEGEFNRSPCSQD